MLLYQLSNGGAYMSYDGDQARNAAYRVSESNDNIKVLSKKIELSNLFSLYNMGIITREELLNSKLVLEYLKTLKKDSTIKK